MIAILRSITPYFQFLVFLGTITIFSSHLSAELESNLLKPFPQVGSGAVGLAGAGNANNPQFIGKNPAIISNIYSQTFFFDHFTNSSDYMGLYTGYFSTIGSWAFGFGGLATALPENRTNFATKNYAFAGAALTLGIPIFNDIFTGASFYYNQPRSSKSTVQYGVHLGSLYTLNTNFKGIFGVHQFNFGVNLEIEYNYVQDEGVIWRVGPTPGLSLVFFNLKYLDVEFFLDFPFQPNFIRFPTNFGFNVKLFNFLRMTVGSSSNDFFKMTHMHYGAGLFYTGSNFAFQLDTFQITQTEESPENIEYRANFAVVLRYLHDRVTMNDSIIDTRTPYAFSPNSDGVKDTVNMKLPYDLIKDAIDWNFSIVDKAGKSVYVAENKFLKPDELEKMPEEIIWDGTGVDKKVLPDGEYNGTLFVMKRDGTVTQTDLAAITLDTSPPKALFENEIKDYNLLSDRNPILFTLRANNNELEDAQFEIQDSNSLTIHSDYCLGYQLPCEFSWWPKNTKELKSGTFFPVIMARDKSGNRTKIKGSPVRISYGKDPFVIEFHKSKIPTQEVFEKGLKIAIKNQVDYQFGRLRLEIFNELGEPLHQIRLVRDRQRSSLQTIWRGEGIDPKYNGLLNFRVRHFIEEKDVILATESILLDSVKPVISLNVSPNKNFIPGYSQENLLFFKSEIQEKNRINRWQLIVKDVKYDKVRFTTGGVNAPPAPLLTWNGLEGEETPLLSETDYYTQLEVEDEVGNIGLSNKVGFRTGLRLDAFPGEDKVISLNGRELKLGKKNKYVIQLPNILFLPNSDQPIDESRLILLNTVAPILAKFEDFNFSIEGHINNPDKTNDPYGIKPEGIELSYRRALRVTELLRSQGIDAKKMKSLGYGATRPLSKDETEEELSKNRRVEIVLIRKKKI